MREAPSRVTISELVKLSATIVAHNPVAMPEANYALEFDFQDTPRGGKKHFYS
jgi:UDPglucose 6-dehydrogenase